MKGVFFLVTIYFSRDKYGRLLALQRMDGFGFSRGNWPGGKSKELEKRS